MLQSCSRLTFPNQAHSIYCPYSAFLQQSGRSGFPAAFKSLVPGREPSQVHPQLGGKLPAKSLTFAPAPFTDLQRPNRGGKGPREVVGAQSSLG